jgi:hypothetical protein
VDILGGTEGAGLGRGYKKSREELPKPTTSQLFMHLQVHTLILLALNLSVKMLPSTLREEMAILAMLRTSL